MKRIRILGLCLVAAFALTIVAASTASAAEPALFACVKQAGGKFSDKACTKAGEGKTAKFELVEGVGKKATFKGKGGAATLHTPAVGGEVKCGGFKDSGTNSSATTESKVVSIFTKCTSLGKNCVSPGAKKGEIKTNNLKGVLGYINKGSKKVGVALSAESGSILAEFNCEGLEIVTTGSVIGEVTPVNSFSKSQTDTFSVNGEGLQSVTAFEGEAAGSHKLESKINGSGPFPSGQQATAVNKGENLEIKA
jgi:hypothetical protein